VQFLVVRPMMSVILNLQKISPSIKKVVECPDDQLPYTGDGVIINSPLLNGLKKNQAISKIIKYFEDNKLATNLLIIK
jgi:hypothetical protein